MTYDVVVIGAGIVGSCTAYHCRKLGLKCLQIEQYHVGHWHGSSHGMSRITRLVHLDEAYVPMIRDTYQQIAAFETERGEKLWEKTGMLWLSEDDFVDKLAKTSEATGLDYELLDNEEVNKRYPQLTFDSKWRGIYDPNGGLIFAEKWLRLYQEEYRRLGGEIREEETYLGFTEKSTDFLEIRTSKATYSAKKLIICAGTWLQTADPMISKITGLQLERIAVGYWKTKEKDDLEKFSKFEMPVMIIRDSKTGRNDNFLPPRDYPDTIKYFSCKGPVFDVNDLETEKNVDFERSKSILSKYFPLVDASDPIRVDRCKFTMSPDKNYVLDYHPTSKNVLIGGCMSGSGFKVAPGFGHALAELAAGNPPPFDVSIFSLKRFEK